MMNTVQTKFKKAKRYSMSQIIRFAQCDCGATAIEYALIASAMGLALIAALPALTSGIGIKYDTFAAWFAAVS